jgi:hypothetical protein
MITLQRARLAAFTFLEQKTQLHGETLPRSALGRGFDFEGRSIVCQGANR